MLDYKTREAQARGIYQAGLKRCAEKPEPDGQKFPCGSRVRITGSLGSSMSHFPSGVEATVEYVYAHAYGGSDVKSYSLKVDYHGSVAWYDEHQLTAIRSSERPVDRDANKGETMIVKQTTDWPGTASPVERLVGRSVPTLWQKAWMRAVSAIAWAAWRLAQACECVLIGKRAMSAYRTAIQSPHPERAAEAAELLQSRDELLSRALGEEHFAGTIRVMRNQMRRYAKRA